MLVPHQNPDGDALGSVTAFAEFLLNHGKEVTIFCKTGYPPAFHYLANLNIFTSDTAAWNGEPYDTVMVFDSGDLAYAGVESFIADLPYSPTIVNIDHHATNIFYGDYNMVDTTASSTCEMLHRFFRYNHYKITPTMATSLMTGLMTDTDNFTNGATSKAALAVGEDLIRRGANRPLIRRQVFTDTTIPALKLWGRMLSRLTHHEPHDLVYTYVTQADISEHGATEDDTSGVANFMNNLSEGKAAMILKERPDGTVKGSFRTVRDDLDVACWARALGGGGHTKAAGFTVTGTIEEAIDKIFAAIAQAKCIDAIPEAA